MQICWKKYLSLRNLNHTNYFIALLISSFMSFPLKEAVICYLRHGYKTLLIDYTQSRHPIHQGKFCAPGGKINDGETSEHATRREVMEETEIVVRNLIYRGKVLFKNEKRTVGGKPMISNWLVYFYDCQDFDDSNAKGIEGRLDWIDNHNILNLPMHEGDKIIWEKWLSQQKEFNGEIVHEAEVLVSAELVK